MRIIFLLAILAFPVAEIWLLINLTQQYGWLFLLYLVVIGMLGLQLIRDEKLLLSGQMIQNLKQANNPLKVIFSSARNIIAGILLIIPGVITDFIAVILLLIPIKKEGQAGDVYRQQAANDDVIEGEFHRED